MILYDSEVGKGSQARNKQKNHETYTFKFMKMQNFGSTQKH